MDRLIDLGHRAFDFSAWALS